MKRTLLLAAYATASLLIHTAAASVTGALSEANCAGGGFTWSATTITWLPAGIPPGSGCIVTGGGTNLSWSSGGSMGPGVTGAILNLAPGGGAITNFMTFAPTNTLNFVLTSLGPGS